MGKRKVFNTSAFRRQFTFVQDRAKHRDLHWGRMLNTKHAAFTKCQAASYGKVPRALVDPAVGSLRGEEQLGMLLLGSGCRPAHPLGGQGTSTWPQAAPEDSGRGLLARGGN